MEKEVEQAMLAAGSDDEVRVIILTGAGRGFCAGPTWATWTAWPKSNDSAETLQADLGERFAGRKRDGVRARLPEDLFLLSGHRQADHRRDQRRRGRPGAWSMSLYCDIRFASDQAKFSTAFARRGLIAEHGISWMLPRLVGVSNALDLLFSARLIDAAEALRMGLVSRVIPQDQFAAEVRKYAIEAGHRLRRPAPRGSSSSKSTTRCSRRWPKRSTWPTKKCCRASPARTSRRAWPTFSKNAPPPLPESKHVKANPARRPSSTSGFPTRCSRAKSICM